MTDYKPDILIHPGETLKEELEAKFDIKYLTEYQWRVNNSIDIFPTNKRYHDIKYNERGDYDDIITFLEEFFSKRILCPYCNREPIWCENKEIYGRNYGKSYMCYFCKSCDAYVGCHNNSRKPLGIMANRETRTWRKKAHSVLDPLWKNGQYKRKDLYQQLSNHFGKIIHIGESDIQQCKNIINFLEEQNDTKTKN